MIQYIYQKISGDNVAKIIRKSRSLEEKRSTYQNQMKKKSMLAVSLFAVSIVSGAFLLYYNRMLMLCVPLLLGLLAVGLLASIISLENEIDILEAGIEGENSANGYMAMLPESYTIFRNLTIHHQEKSSEIDTLVVGPTGIFVIEIKHLNGHILGDISDPHWAQHKVGRAGTPYTKMFYSPVKQVNTHVYRTANYLRENGIRTHIDAIVYFSNTDTTAEILGDDGKTALFFASDDGADRMLHHILNNHQQLSQTECNKIINLLQNT